ncbi:MAG: lysylphosphatidylglycerol synthase transmembrane domain-containing protein, partial [Desulfobacterales bacterium]|jgi:hypothetical protein
MNRPSLKYRYLIRSIGIVLLVVILTRVDLGDVGRQLQNCRPLAVVLAIFLIVPQVALRAYRWQGLMARLAIRCSWRQALIFYFTGIFVGLVTPGRLGELAKGVFLKQYGIASIGRSLPSVLADRILDLLVLMGLALLALPYLDLMPHAGKVSLLMLGLMAVFIALGLKWLTTSSQLSVFAVKIRKRLKTNWSGSLDDFVAGSRTLIAPGLWTSLVWTVAGYAVFFIQTTSIGYALGLPADFMTIAMVVSISILVGFIPITFAGLGTRDAVLIFLFGQTGVSETAALGFAILYIFVNVICLGIISSVFWFFLPQRPAGFNDQDA